MAPRKTPNQLSPQDFPKPASASGPPSPSFPRSTSPSNGFTQFFSKPGKWFNRKPSVGGGGSTPGIQEPPRSSTSSGRMPRISRPTDPRPILASRFQSDSRVSTSASRSVLDLSSRPPGSLDISHSFPSPTHSSPPGGGGLGDLRNISRKGWSRSADDLGKFSSPLSSPVDSTFHNKITQYRNRSNSNATLAPSSANTNIPTNMRQPFPTIVTTSPLSSSPDENDGFNSPVSISFLSSSPTKSSLDKPLPLDPNPQGLGGVHNRSHSFTPKLPSKLSAQKLGFGPSSPKRKGSAPSERDIELDREKLGLDARGATGGPNQPSISPTAARSAAVLSTLGVNAAPTTPDAARSTVMLAPPTIIEPGMGDDDLSGSSSKRTSQIVYNSGFINRLTELPVSHHPYHAPNLTLAKGWKPFKLELKGAKLFFYKPPSDRNAAVRDLFPIDLVPALEEEQEAELEAGKAEDQLEPSSARRLDRGDEGTPTRKKRAYWGRRTHPDLAVGQHGVDTGTFEALVHETVFATTFLRLSNESDGAALESREAMWREFASAILLCLPSLVGQAKFESEFTRCCSYLVSGASDEMKEGERSRVMWLAGEYLRFHGSPIEVVEWEEWKTETIPDFTFTSIGNTSSGLVSSHSTQALYSLSPNPDRQTYSHIPGAAYFTPEADDKMASLMDALAGPSMSVSPEKITPKQQRASLPQNNRIWSALEREGLSREVLLVLDPYLIASSLGLFHRTALREVPENLTAEYIFSSEGTSGNKNLNQPNDTSPPTSFPAALFGSDKSPHWLTKILLMQILGVDTSTGSLTSPQFSTPGRKSEEKPIQSTSRTHSRSEVISVWAKVGELCRLAGDECSWQAIVAALCSRPVARLDKAWKRVNSDALTIVDSWIYPGADGDCASVQDPRITPWGGDVKDKIKEILERSRGENGQGWIVEPLTKVREIFEGTRTAFSLCPRRVDPNGPETREDAIRMMAFWGELCAGNARGGTLGSKFAHIEQFMSLSLAAEPRRKCLFEPFYWSQLTVSPPIHPLSPLLFPEPLPVISLVNRGEIWQGRTEIGVSNLNLIDLQFLRSLEPRSDDRRSSDSKEILSGAGGVDLLGSVIAVYDGELLLIIQRGGPEPTPAASRSSSRAPSRPISTVDEVGSIEHRVSRTPSIRVKTGPLDRKPSVARRSSLPSISQRPTFVISETSSEPPLRVSVHGGTVDRLVEILVHGLQGVSVSVADDNGEMPLRESKTRDLYVNHEEFAKVWWNVFRSFVTPLVFFELMQKRYPRPHSHRQLSVSDCLDLINKRSRVIDAMNEWIFQGGGAQDVLDDPKLFSTARAFLDSQVLHAAPDLPAMEDFAVQQAWSTYEESRISFNASFTCQTMRPTSRDISVPKLAAGTSKARNHGRDPPDIDHIDPEQLVENLDAMAAAAFSNVSEEDLFVTTDLLEVQTADRAGWFIPKESNSTTDDIEIQTMYSHILEVEPSSMISELSQGAIYRLLPPGIRSCIRAYIILRKWLISKIVAFQIGIRARQARIDLLLRAIQITRLRNADPSPSNASVAERPCIRSFVEAVLTSAIVSVESRAHHRAWQNVAATRGAQCDSLSSLLRRPFAQLSTFPEPLTVDMSWLLEKILEIVSMPDLLTPTSEDGPSVVNFDKRRHICKLVMSASGAPAAKKIKKRHDVDRRDFERLNIIEREVNLLVFDPRGIREEAHREGMQATVSGSSSGRKAVRPFQKLVIMQQEKNKRDRHLRERVSREKKQEQQRNERREESISKHIQQRTPGVSAQRQHRNKKSMSSAFFQFMRPISSAFTSEYPDPSTVKRTPAELDFTPSGKPILVLNVVDAKVAQFINNERSFTFQLDTEDGGHYLLQALNRREMMKWLDAISRVAKSAAKRRLTYLGSPKPQLADHIHNNPTTASRDPRAVFGVDINFLLQREAANNEVLPGAIPFVIERCLYEVESRGLNEVGIYRIAGATSEIATLKDAFNRGQSPIEPTTDIHAVCDLIKSWFRVLPEPLFPPSSYYDVVEAMKMTNFDSRLSKIRTIVRELPEINFNLLKRVAEHLDKVTDFEEQNHMTADALAIVFSPNLLRAPQNDFAMILSNMGHTHKLVKALITHFHVIFDDADQEVENDQDEEEFDEPILEEDEGDESMSAPSFTLDT